MCVPSGGSKLQGLTYFAIDRLIRREHRRRDGPVEGLAAVAGDEIALIYRYEAVVTPRRGLYGG